MSDTPDNLSACASLCFDPDPALTQPPLTEIEPAISPSTDAHAETPTLETMGNQQSGEGSLRRRGKKKSKNKDDKGKGIASALFKDPVFGASGMGVYGGSSVDEAATPNKRKKETEQTKSPRPIRSTYDNVNQSGSVTNLCDASEMYTSDLFLDTVSRLDVSMTSQTETAGIRHHVDPQTIDNVSHGGSSLAESGFITPALATPQVKRNQLAGAMATSDSVTELGKEIERTIFERLSASQKAGNAEAQPEASHTSSPKSNEVKMTLVMQSPIPPRKAVTEVKLPEASPRTAKLEFIKSSQDDVNSDPEIAKSKPLKPFVESKIEIDLKTGQPVPEENVPRAEVSDDTDKADNELMEKEYKPVELKQILEKKTDPDLSPEDQIQTKEKPKELGVSSSSDENCGDFEKVKLHIEEEDVLVATDQEKKTTTTNVKEEELSQKDTSAGQATTIADHSSDHNTTPSVAAAGQQSTLVKPNVPKQEIVSQEEVDKKAIQIEPKEKIEKPARTSAGARRRRERTKAETPKEEKMEKSEEGSQENTERSELVIASQTLQMKCSEVTASPEATVAAAAAVATKPLESTVRIIDLPQMPMQTDENVSVVNIPEAACEELIRATEFASVEQAQMVIRRPAFQHDQEFPDNQTLTVTKKAEESEFDPEAKHDPDVNFEPEMIDDQIIPKKGEGTDELKLKTKEKIKEKTSIVPSEQSVLIETSESIAKEQSDQESVNIVSTPKVDENPTRNTNDPPKEEASAEKSSGELSDKVSKSKKDRKRKRKKAKRQSLDTVTSPEVEAKEMPELEDTSSRKDSITVSSTEDTEKGTTDESGDSSSTAFGKHALQQQTTIIERTGYQKDGDENNKEADDKPIDACDLFLQSEEFRNQEPCETETPESTNSNQRQETPLVTIDTNLTVDSPASSEILSDEPTPTNDRTNQLRAFYIPDRSQKSRAKLFCVVDREKTKESETEININEEKEKRDEIQQQEHQQSPDSEIKPSGPASPSEKKANDGNESKDNVIAKTCPEGTNMKTEQKRKLRISLTSEEVSEIFQNFQTRLNDEACSNSKPSSHRQEAEDEVKDINGSDRKDHENGDEISDDDDHRKERTKHISSLTLSDIDSSLPETLPELADLQNFLEYIKIGEQPTRGETPPFSPKAETGRSSPNENSNSRRLSRISPAITDRSVTESDLDISEQRDDLSTDSNIFADDEDESSSELLFTKTYTEPDQGGEVCVSCTVVNTNADDDSDEFWAENSASEEVYRRIESSTQAVTTVFDNARLQMQDIHSHLHNLRLQMESLQESLDNASILSQEYYNMDNDQVTSQEFYSLEKGLLVSQEYFSRSKKAQVTPEEYSPVDIGPVLTEEYYSSTLGKPPLL